VEGFGWPTGRWWRVGRGCLEKPGQEGSGNISGKGHVREVSLPSNGEGDYWSGAGSSPRRAFEGDEKENDPLRNWGRSEVEVVNTSKTEREQNLQNRRGGGRQLGKILQPLGWKRREKKGKERMQPRTCIKDKRETGGREVNKSRG